MRNIKFRVFSKKVKGMVFLEHAVYIVDDKIHPKNNYVLMQYTGVKDKNGIEIYEGDIVKITIDRSIFCDDIAKICFKHGCFKLCSVDFEDESSEHIKYSGYTEVIGNMYENPELLEQQ